MPRSIPDERDVPDLISDHGTNSSDDGKKKRAKKPADPKKPKNYKKIRILVAVVVVVVRVAMAALGDISYWLWEDEVVRE